MVVVISVGGVVPGMSSGHESASSSVCVCVRERERERERGRKREGEEGERELIIITEYLGHDDL